MKKSSMKKLFVLPSVFLSAIFYGYESIWFICFVLPIYFFSRPSIIVWVSTFSFLTFLSYLNINKFELFMQARYFIHLNPIGILNVDYFLDKAHISRYLVAYPSILLSKITLYNIDVTYTLYCIGLISSMAVIFSRIFEILNDGEDSVLKSILASSIICVISIFINGRMIPAYFGLSILLWRFAYIFSFYKNIKYSNEKFINANELTLIFLGFFFTTVSSGTMMVSFTLILVSLFLMFFMFKKENYTFFSKILFFGGLTVIGSFAFFMTVRNFVYFQDDLFELLNHGLGRFMGYSYLYVILAFIVPFFMILFYSLILKAIKNKPALFVIIIAIPIPFMLGIFGISTLTMFIIPSTILLSNMMLSSTNIENIR